MFSYCCQACVVFYIYKVYVITVSHILSQEVQDRNISNRSFYLSIQVYKWYISPLSSHLLHLKIIKTIHKKRKCH